MILNIKLSPLLLCFFWIFITLILTPLNAYEVHFEGITDSKLLSLIQKTSQLEKLRDSPPQTKMGLKKRAEADVDNIKQTLHSFAYYDAQATVSFSDDESTVTVSINLGPVFPLKAFTIRYFQKGEEKDADILHCPISLKKIHVTLGNPALPEMILTGEDTLLDQLNLQGFAFASIIKRDVFVDEQGKEVIVLIAVETGPLAIFGSLNVQGLKNVKRSFICKKLRWQEGEVYSPLKIEKTQEAIELSALFRSVSIAPGAEAVNDNEVAIDISLVEAKQHSIGAGISYNTELGFGASGEWENRNLLGEGQKLSARTEVWQKLQDGRISYVIPDYLHQDQNLIWMVDYHKDYNKSFTEHAFSVSGIIERKWNENLDFSYGLMYKILRSQRSSKNGTFDLIKVPLQIRWSKTDNLLDPTTGHTLIYRAVPTLQAASPSFAYCINSITGTYYQPLTKNKKHVFAFKLMVGSIFGGSRNEIPTPERFFAGSETSIRGYRFMSVSPLGRHDKPLGGRSLFIYTLELRNRLTETFGLVFFYDMGNVYKNELPDFRKKFLQSGGIGLRYYTPIGPIRLDLAFPFNRRKKQHKCSRLDHLLEAYFSIGQSF